MADRAARKPKVKRTEAVSLRGRVPALLPVHAEALREFFAEARHWLLRDGGVLYFMAGPHGDGETFAIDADGARLALRLDASGTIGDGQGLRWNDHVGRSRVLAWSLAHEAQLMRLSDALGVSLLPVVDGSGVDATDANDLWLDFSIEDPTDEEQATVARTRGALRIPATWLARLAGRAVQVYADDPLPPLGRWRDLTATVSILFAIPALGGRDWQALRPGDAIVVGRRSRPPPFQAHAAGRVWPLAPVPNGWRVESAAQSVSPSRSLPPSQEHTRMSDNDSNDPAAVNTAAVEDPARSLPVRVEFEIGQIEMSVGELADLQPGYVFALPAHLEGANVVIRANGRATGRGEVVAVGDTLGVRLLSWS